MSEPLSKEEFFKFINVTPTNCWEWTRCLHHSGYGIVRQYGQNVFTHRAAWEFTKGSIPEGSLVLHKCDNKKCINPDHLELGTHRKNMSDMVSRGRSFIPDRRGEKAYTALLTAQKVKEIRSLFPSYSMKELAELYSVAQRTIYSVVKRENWKSIPKLTVEEQQEILKTLPYHEKKNPNGLRDVDIKTGNFK